MTLREIARLVRAAAAGWVDDSATEDEAKEATDGCYAASKMLVGGSFVLSVWVPNKEILLTPVDYVTIQSDAHPDGLIIVPWSALPDLAGALAEPLDEKHLLLKRASDAEWTALVEKALTIAVPSEPTSRSELYSAYGRAPPAVLRG